MCRTVGYGVFGVSGVCGGAKEVLVRVCWFNVKFGGDAVVVVESNNDV